MGAGVTKTLEEGEELFTWTPVGKLAFAGQQGDVRKEHEQPGGRGVDGGDDDALRRTDGNNLEEEADELAHDGIEAWREGGMKGEEM